MEAPIPQNPNPLSTTPAVQMTTDIKPRPRKIPTLILSLIFFVLIIVMTMSAILFFIQSPEVAPPVQMSTLDTSDWKTYQDPSGYFTFKIPPAMPYIKLSGYPTDAESGIVSRMLFGSESVAQATYKKGETENFPINFSITVYKNSTEIGKNGKELYQKEVDLFNSTYTLSERIRSFFTKLPVNLSYRLNSFFLQPPKKSSFAITYGNAIRIIEPDYALNSRPKSMVIIDNDEGLVVFVSALSIDKDKEPFFYQIMSTFDMQYHPITPSPSPSVMFRNYTITPAPGWKSLPIDMMGSHATTLDNGLYNLTIAQQTIDQNKICLFTDSDIAEGDILNERTNEYHEINTAIGTFRTIKSGVSNGYVACWKNEDSGHFQTISPVGRIIFSTPQNSEEHFILDIEGMLRTLTYN